jgi:hypothetical protein
MTEHALYTEEYKFVFSNRGSGVRKVVVISALIEQQIALLTEQFLLKQKVKFTPKSIRYFYESLDILVDNFILTKEDAKEIKDFREDRNIALHRIFSGMTRNEWNNTNAEVVTKGRPIIKKLEKKLLP